MENTSDFDALALEVFYTKGAGSSMGLVIDVTNTLGVRVKDNLSVGPTRTSDDWFRRVVESTTGSITDIVQQEYEIEASGRYAILVQPVRAKAIRIGVRGGGGSIDGSNCIIDAHLTNTYRG